jgi:signal transduction histidine kinase/CheY-like chemotaxis protein
MVEISAEFARMTRPLPEAHFLIQVDGRILAANRAAAALIGRPLAELVGSSLAEIAAGDPAELLGYLGRAATSGDLIPGSFEIEAGSGRRRCRCAAARIPADGTTLLLLRGEDTRSGHDPFLLLKNRIADLQSEVRRRMALEAEREELLRRERDARETAEEANRLKDEFLAVVSHELRTPLNAIIGWVSMLTRDEVPPDKRAHALETIERASNAQAHLVEDLLDISRMTRGELRLEMTTVQPAEVVEAAIDTLRPTAEAKGVHLDVVLDAETGPVTGDPDRLRQVVWNLVSNAIKFTPAGGQVQVRLERVDSHVDLIVSDTGAGIDPAFLPFVFERFRQGQSSLSRTHGGAGLGLAIVRYLVEAHGGVIHAHSEGEGQGATFIMSLPILLFQRPPALDPAPVRAGNPERRAPAMTDGARPGLDGVDILLVEDHEASREMVELLLRNAGAHVTAVATAADAHRELDRGAPDILVCDIQLPGEDGYSFVRKIRLRPEHEGGRIPAVALTAFGRGEDRVRALEAGFQVHMAKPVDPAELLALVRALVFRTSDE